MSGIGGYWKHTTMNIGFYILEWFIYKTFGQSSKTTSLGITLGFHTPNGMQTRGKANPHMKVVGMFQQMA